MSENLYLAHYNHNHDRLGRFARSTGAAASSVGGKVVKSKKKQAAPKPDIKKGKAANTKLSESDRNRIVNSGSAKEVQKYKDRLSTRELESAVIRLERERVQRIDLDRKLSALAEPSNRKSMMAKIEKYSSDLERISNAAEKAAKLYNTAAKAHNLMSPATDQWPIYGEKKKPDSVSKEVRERGKALTEYKLKTSELEAIQKRKETLDKARDYDSNRAKSQNDPVSDNNYQRDLAKSELERKQAEKDLSDYNRKVNTTKSVSKPSFYTSKSAPESSASPAAPEKSASETSTSPTPSEPESSRNTKSASKPAYVYNRNTKAAQNYVKNNYDTMLSDVVSNSGYSDYFSELEKRKIKYQ